MGSPHPKWFGLSTYWKLIGKLLYLSQFLSCPKKPHLQVVMYVIRYLKKTTNLGLFYSDSDLKLSAYSDAYLSTCLFSSRSYSAYCVFLGSRLISWKTKKQIIVGKSSAKAEHMSMSSTPSEMVWLEGCIIKLMCLFLFIYIVIIVLLNILHVILFSRKNK